MGKTNPGINPQLVRGHFDPEEWAIIKNLSNEWYITSGGGVLKLGKTSVYKYFLMKPIDAFRERFNLERELLVLFSPYSQFEPRTLDAIDQAAKNYQQLRLERIVSVLISKDDRIEDKLRSLLAPDKEVQVVVPFTYNELSHAVDETFISNRFREHFYQRDLFAFEGPLTKDLYFFGRTNLIHDMVNRYKSDESSGLFGLRKSGKTSIVLAVSRVLQRDYIPSVRIDCEVPSFHRRRWNKALAYVISQIVTEQNLEYEMVGEDEYTEYDASTIFENEIRNIRDILGNRLLLIFDEVEHITFGIGSSNHWRDEVDFVYFWQTIRAIFQKPDHPLSVIITGTNPRCVEEPRVKGIDNPLFSFIPFQYVPRFDYHQTKEMVQQLGQIMGLLFDEWVCAKLSEDFGGHPFLIRHVASVMHKLTKKERPAIVGKNVYEKSLSIFNRDSGHYVDMILEVLHRFYSDEYEMLKYLALGDYNTFLELAAISPNYTSHLLGYGVIECEGDDYVLKIDAIKEHLAQLEKYKALNLTQEQRLTEINSRRNKLEPRLRTLVRTLLAARFGKKNAYEKVIHVLDGKGEKKLNVLSYNELFDPDKSTIYFSHLKRLICNNWDCFNHVFEIGKKEFEFRMDSINKYRKDAHAAKIDDDALAVVRACFNDIERSLSDFTDSS